jgi:exopolysaccharide biosynthesis polyprenyl glycosylphosphotransferase
LSRDGTDLTEEIDQEVRGEQVGTLTTNQGALQGIKDLFIAQTQPREETYSQPSRNPFHLFQQVLPEELFLGMLCLERKRTERSNKRFILMLVDGGDAYKQNSESTVTKGIIAAINATRRETDVAGWYKHGMILGVIFTELSEATEASTSQLVLHKVKEHLSKHLPMEIRKDIYVSVHSFGEDTDKQDPDTPGNPTFYPDLFHRDESKKTELQVKRIMDIVGSLIALIISLPFFLIIAAVIKLTSKGPVFFAQERLGQFGRTFTCLKFRTMSADNDSKIHQEFMKGLIRGEQNSGDANGDKPVYKMTNDPRVTGIGRFLRKTSLDELPQFLNVLSGEMSLVGPRPPIAYEFEEYDVWHRRRVLEIKPGITGLWQVEGRSRVKFDDMVRLDLQYARGWSLWLDVQILLKTPAAVVFGNGAY